MTRALFLADQFSDSNRSEREQHPGGAELTDQAAIDACPWPVTALTFATLASHGSALERVLAGFDVIVVANSKSATPAVLREIARTGRYVAFEHDLRICRWRGNFPATRDPVHRASQRCWCPHLDVRELFRNARGVVFLTSLQERYYRANPFFECPPSRVLGCSLFKSSLLEAHDSHGVRNGTCVFASPNTIKGHAEALVYCKERGLDLDADVTSISQRSHESVLELFRHSQRFVYLPIGPEWAGRMVVEARLLGCNVVANDLVGVVGESFWSADRGPAVDFLTHGPKRFWSLVEELFALPTQPAAGRAGWLAHAADKLTWALQAAPKRLWPLGPTRPRVAMPREFQAW